MLPNIGAPELVIILVIALLILGPGKLPDVGAALGRSIREFRKATTEIQESVNPTIPPKAASAQQPPAANELSSSAAPNTLSTSDESKDRPA